MLESVLSVFQKSVFIYLDTKGKQVRIYDQKRGEVKKDNVVLIDMDIALVNEGNFAKMIEYALQKLNESGKKLPNGTAVTVILPNSAVSIDYFNLPTMKKKNIGTALRTNFSKLYRNEKELALSDSIILTNKKNTVVKCVIIQKAITASIKAALTKQNLGLKAVTCEAFCLADAAMQINSKIRKHDFVFLNVNEGYSDIVICGKDKVLGFASLPYGKEIIKTDEIVSEYDHMDNDIAELAVLNAKEYAKAKKLTVSMELDTTDNEVSEKPTEKSDEAVENEASVDAVESNEIDVTVDGEPIESEHKLSKEEMVNLLRDIEQEEQKKNIKQTDEDDEEEDIAPQIVPDKIKVFVRKPKKYPKFMLRDIPETPEGYISENFRIFHKQVLLYAQQCKLVEYYPKMEFAVINIDNVPENIIIAAGQEIEDSLPLKSLVSDNERNKDLLNNLVLYGAAHLRTHSKNPKL